MPKYLTIAKAAAAYELSEGFLRSMVRRGEVPFIKSGNRKYINVDALFEHMQAEGKANMEQAAADGASL